MSLERGRTMAGWAYMCGSYSIAIEKEEVFGVPISEPFMKRYNAAASQELPVITLSPAWMYKMKMFAA
jgi:hypothetical protein